MKVNAYTAPFFLFGKPDFVKDGKVSNRFLDCPKML